MVFDTETAQGHPSIAGLHDHILRLEHDLRELSSQRDNLLASLKDIHKNVQHDHYAWKIADDAVSAVEQSSSCNHEKYSIKRFNGVAKKVCDACGAKRG